jgi:hypothetical protein
MKSYVLILSLALLVSSCESLKTRNIVKTGATTVVTYAVAGPVPAIINLGTSIAVDEVLPPENTIKDIESKEQMWAFIWQELFEYVMYTIIGFLLFTSVIGPWAAQRRAKRKMKYDILKRDLEVERKMRKE